MDSYLSLMRDVLHKQAHALMVLADYLDTSFDKAVECVLSVKGRVAVTGMGKSGHIARKVAATMASTGTAAYFIHPAEASHGDLGMMSADDAVIAFSNSGETAELSDILLYASRHGIPVIGVTQKPDSFLARHSDVVLVMPDEPEGCPLGCAPTTSTTLMLATGDALSMALLEARGFGKDDFHQFHPGGKLGSRLAKVADIMHTGDEIPLVSADAAMFDAIYEMSSKGLGCTGVTKNGKLIGIVTDGDLRRHMNADLLNVAVTAVMSSNPRTVSADELASAAVTMMHAASVTTLFIIDDYGAPKGILHIHDCYKAGLH